MQWLDDLDDLIFAGILVWRRASRICLGIGWLAAMSLFVDSMIMVLRTEWFISLSIVAISSVIVWSVAAVSLLRPSLRRVWNA